MRSLWSGDTLLAGAVIALVGFMLGLAVGPNDVLGGIRAFPAPTVPWATILTGLAWPVVVAILLLRFGDEFGRVVTTLAARVAADRKVTLPGGISFERETTEVPTSDSEALLILMTRPGNEPKLEAFIAGLNLTPVPTNVEFATQTLYTSNWAAARHLLEG